MLTASLLEIPPSLTQYGFVFGIAYLAAFLSAPLFAHFGDRLSCCCCGGGAKAVYNSGAFLQCVSGGFAFALVDLIQSKAAFLAASYVLRFLCGVAEAAIYGSVLGILTRQQFSNTQGVFPFLWDFLFQSRLFPDRRSIIMSTCESSYGLGYTVGE